MIRCVQFDHNNVLAELHTEAIFKYVVESGGNCTKPAQLFQGEGQELLDNYDLGNMTIYQFFERWNQLLGAHMDFIKFIDVFGIKLFSPDQDMLDTVYDLRDNGILTVLITNMNMYHLSQIDKYHPELINGYDHRMISCKERIMKPNPEMWIRPMEVLGLKAEECLFIDDTLENISAAQELGISTFHFNVRDDNHRSKGNRDQIKANLRQYLREQGLI